MRRRRPLIVDAFQEGTEFGREPEREEADDEHQHLQPPPRRCALCMRGSDDAKAESRDRESGAEARAHGEELHAGDKAVVRPGEKAEIDAERDEGRGEAEQRIRDPSVQRGSDHIATL